MKYLIAIAFSLLVNILAGQDIFTLEKVPNGAKIKQGQIIIYGNFIQRLGFSSGGFPQDIIVQNVDTKAYLKFRVKPSYKSRKDNTFCYYINPGTYRIISYLWSQSKWYGGMMYGEPIFKGIDVAGYIEKKVAIPSEIIENDSLRYTFTIGENSLYYLGTWNFDSGLVSFSNDISNFNSEMQLEYKKLDFSISVPEIPE